MTSLEEKLKAEEEAAQKKTLEEKIESSKHLINSFGQSKGIR